MPVSVLPFVKQPLCVTVSPQTLVCVPLARFRQAAGRALNGCRAASRSTCQLSVSGQAAAKRRMPRHCALCSVGCNVPRIGRISSCTGRAPAAGFVFLGHSLLKPRRKLKRVNRRDFARDVKSALALNKKHIHSAVSKRQCICSDIPCHAVFCVPAGGGNVACGRKRRSFFVRQPVKRRSL